MHDIPVDRSNKGLSVFSLKPGYSFYGSTSKKETREPTDVWLLLRTYVIQKPEMKFSASGHSNYTKTHLVPWLAVIKYVRASLCGLNKFLLLRQCESSEKKAANVRGDE
jgi:hypothetical protein